MDIVVIGNAISRGNPELEAVLRRKLYYLSLPETLKQFFLRGRHNLVVTGTHGKTTTTALLAWILTSAGIKPSYMIGGIPKNLGQGALFNDSKYFVIEGDEYDTAFFDKRSKFIHYLPELLIVNNIEFDHADIFHDLDEIKLSFRRLINIVPQNGMVLLNGDDPNCVEVAQNCFAPMVEVGFSPNCAQRIREPSYSSDGSQFVFGEDEYRNSARGRVQYSQCRDGNFRRANFTRCLTRRFERRWRNFEGIARRQEERGEARGVKVDRRFRSSPDSDRANNTGVAASLSRPSHLGRVRAAIQHHAPRGFPAAVAGCVESGGRRFYFRRWRASIRSRKPSDSIRKRVVDAIAKSGRPAFYEKNADAIVDRLVPMVQRNDVVAVFSNGGFDRIHEKLLARIEAAAPAAPEKSEVPEHAPLH